MTQEVETASSYYPSWSQDFKPYDLDRYRDSLRQKLALVLGLAAPKVSQRDQLAGRLQEIVDRQAVLIKHQEDLDAQLTLRNQDRTMLEFAQEAFGPQGVKNLLLRDYETLVQQNLEQYSTWLTQGEIQLGFSAQQQLKSGEWREKMEFTVKVLGGAQQYEDLSSGEKQRVDLCLIFSLQDLVQDLHRSHLHLRLYDEMFEHLDEAGVQGVMTMLTEQRQTQGTLCVISHNPHLLAYPHDSLVRVIKTAKGSVIEVEG